MTTLSLYPFNNLERYFESFFGDTISAPAVDIQENENAYVLAMDLPGFDEKNIDIHVDGSNLTIASRQDEKKSDENQSAGQKTAYILRERRKNAFSRSFKLPENANPEAVNASFKNGVLHLEINKRPEAQKRTIQINAA